MYLLQRNTVMNLHCTCSYRVFDLHPPVKEFRVAIVIQELDYARTDGTEVWVNRATLEVGPHRTVVKSNTLTVCTHDHSQVCVCVTLHVR